MSIDSLYISTAVVKQVSTTDNIMGGTTKSFSTRIESLSCRMWPKTIREADEYGKMTMREVWKLACAATATNKAIAESDRIEINDRTYEVTGIGNPSLMDHHLEIDLMEVR